MEPQEVIDLWNKICVPPFRKVKKLTATRALQIKYASNDIDDWEEFFRIAATKEGNWLMNKQWMCFDWAIDPEHRMKIYEEGFLDNPHIDADDEDDLCVPR